jgi:hypothetical protein
MQTPLFEVLTRAFRRPTMLAQNRASLAAQSDAGWIQTLLVDDVGIGVPAANARLADVEVVGGYIWVLDDDDVSLDRFLFAHLRQVVEAAPEPPAAFVVRMDHGPLGVLPPLQGWGVLPAQGRIGASSLIVRRDIWYQYRDHWRSGRYEADYDFIAAVLRNERAVVWLHVVAAQVQRISRGAPE